MNNPTFEETLEREKHMIFPSSMDERTLNALAHHENILMALEKQVAQVPYVDGYADEAEVWDYYCPYCGYDFENYESVSYCSNCGQKINWHWDNEESR